LHLLDLSIYNAHIIYKQITGKKEKFSKFHLLCAIEVLQKYQQDTVIQAVIIKDTDNFPLLLSGRHFISRCSDQNGPISKLARRRYVVCSKHKRWKDTLYECKECNVKVSIKINQTIFSTFYQHFVHTFDYTHARTHARTKVSFSPLFFLYWSVHQVITTGITNLRVNRLFMIGVNSKYFLMHSG
jgi:hypothetical protein